MSKREAMAWIILGILGLALFLMSREGAKVEWAGMPMVSDGTENWGHIPKVDMGLRRDGMVVWRLKEK